MNSNLKQRQENVGIMNLAKDVLRRDFTDAALEESSSRILNDRGNFTYNNVRPNNIVDMKLIDTLSKISFMVQFGDIKREVLNTPGASVYHEHIRNSIIS